MDVSYKASMKMQRGWYHFIYYSHSRIVIPLFGGRIKTLQQEDTSQHEEKTNSRGQTSVIVWLMTKWRLHREVEETNIWPLH